MEKTLAPSWYAEQLSSVCSQLCRNMRVPKSQSHLNSPTTTSSPSIRRLRPSATKLWQSCEQNIRKFVLDGSLPLLTPSVLRWAEEDGILLIMQRYLAARNRAVTLSKDPTALARRKVSDYAMSHECHMHVHVYVPAVDCSPVCQWYELPHMYMHAMSMSSALFAGSGLLFIYRGPVSLVVMWLMCVTGSSESQFAEVPQFPQKASCQLPRPCLK